MARQLFSGRWLLATLLVAAAVGVMIRLGFWQLDRLEQRRAFNQRVLAQVDRPALDLNQALATPAAADRLDQMEYRAVQVRGAFLPEQQVVWRNQVHLNQPGFHLITPLRIDGADQVVLVDRGWIPLGENSPEMWTKYNQAGPITITGVIRRSHTPPRFAGVPDPTLAPGQERLAAWHTLNVVRIAQQVDFPLLPVYVQQTPPGGVVLTDAPPPVPEPVNLDLSEGSHAGYALQWFAFAAVLGLGYPFYLRKQLGGEAKSAGTSSEKRSANSDRSDRGAL